MVLNRKQETMRNDLGARTDKRNEPRPKALTGIKKRRFEALEAARISGSRWYLYLIEQFKKR